MAREHKATRRPSKRILAAISEGLEEIDAHFEMSGFTCKKVISSIAEAAEEIEAESADEDDSDYYGESQELEYFDREDIEVAIDAFISQLIKANVVRKSSAGKTPSFSEVFERYFGDAHEITENAKKFEEYVEGYFGAIAPEDMRAAYEQFCEIQEAVRKDLGDGDVEK
jgi:hypothetical protein